MISVIIPFYSNFNWLADAVESVLNQTYKDFEIIVVNDGSKEFDTQFLSKYGNKIIYHRQINSGPARARNVGIEMASGEFVAFLDSDDFWLPQKLEMQVAYMVSSELAWSHTGYSLFDDSTGRELSTVDVSYFYGSVFSRSLISSPVATPCVMIRSDILKSNPTFRFSEIMRFGQDGYMWLILSTKYEIGVLSMPLTKVRMRGSNAALKARVHLQVKFQIWEAINTNEEFKMAVRDTPSIVKISYCISSINFKIIRILERSWDLKPKFIELLSKFLYLPSYALLKIQKTISF